MDALIRQMGHVALGVPDPMASARDLALMTGLAISGERDGTVFLSSGRRAWEMAYSRSDAPCVLAIGLEATDAAAVAEIRRRVTADGLDIIAERPLHHGIDHAIRFRGPCGTIFEVHSPVARSNDAAGGRVKRIEHVNILVHDVRATGEFLRQTLGLLLSDSAGDDLLSWYRAADGHHHTVALGPGPDKLHHYAFDHRALEDLAGIADRLAEAGRAMIWGPGRHGAGGNVFTYYVDRDGCIVENSIEMMRVDVDALYRPTNWPIGPGMSGRWINLWGGGPPEDFGMPGLPFAPA